MSERQGGGLLEAPWVFWAGLLAATLIGGGVRLIGLEQPSLWVDEFFTVARAGRDPLVWNRALGYLPTLATLWFQGAELGQIGLDNITEWEQLGVTEWSARLGPCLVGVLSIPVLCLAARRVVGNGAAMTAALLLALAPWHIYWSQMARYYTTQFLFANLFLLWLARGAIAGSLGALALSFVAALLAYLAHPTAIVMVGICAGCVALAWVLRIPQVTLPPRTLMFGAAIAGVSAIYLLEQIISGKAIAALGSFPRQNWDASVTVLLLGTAHRIDPVVAGVAGLSAVALARARNPIGVLLGAVAILTPLSFLLLKFWFPIAPRYYFSSFFAWTLLAGLWATEVDRRLGASWGRLAGATGLVALAASVAPGAYLYVSDGAGARARWKDAFAYVEQHGDPGDPVFATPGGYQAQYYLGREARSFPQTATEVASLPTGSWLVQRTRGTQPPTYADRLDVEARYEIPSKPWSWVLYVMRVPKR